MEQDPVKEDEPRSLYEIFREELGDLELRIRHGGLGGVDNYTTWEKQLQTSTEVQDFVSFLLGWYCVIRMMGG